MGICPVGICPVGICPGVFVLESGRTPIRLIRVFGKNPFNIRNTIYDFLEAVGLVQNRFHRCW